MESSELKMKTFVPCYFHRGTGVERPKGQGYRCVSGPSIDFNNKWTNLENSKVVGGLQGWEIRESFYDRDALEGWKELST